MSVYVIAQLKFLDRAAYDRYQAAFPRVFRNFKGRVLAADERPQLLQGTWDREKVVILSFAEEAEARRFLDSPEYREITKDRDAGADVVGFMVQGLG